MVSHHPVRRALAVLVAVAVSVVVLASPGPLAAQEPTEILGFEPPVPPSPANALVIDPAILYGYEDGELVAPPEIDFGALRGSGVYAAGVDTIAVEDDTLYELEAPHVRAVQVQETVRSEIETLSDRIAYLRPRAQQLSTEIRHERSEEARLADEIDTYKRAIAEFAVRTFIGEEELAEALAEPNSEVPEHRVRSDEVRDAHFREIARREQEMAARQARRARLEEDRQAVRQRLRELQTRRLARLEDDRKLDDLVEQTAVDYQVAFHGRLTHMVDRTDIPLVALNAYVIAERTLAEERPRCAIRWWMLAGIGRIESQHGHFGDSTLDVNGYATVPITGPALDGRILSGAEYVTEDTPAPEATQATRETIVEAAPAATPAGTDPAAGDGEAVVGETEAEVPVVKRLALISDTDNGELDGDTRYDRAVGPMQFIPQTWRMYETDGTHDDEKEPQNIYDASLASARYLCTATGSMASEEGQQQAYWAYNHDDEYTESVIAAADDYRRRLRVPDSSPGTSPALGLASVPVDDVQRIVADAVQMLDLSDLPDW